MKNSFDFTQVPADQLVAYYGLAFAAAASDGAITSDEFNALFAMMDLSPLDERQKDIVRGFCIKPPDIDTCFEQLARGSEVLRYAVAFGLVEVLLADDILTVEEEAFLSRACQVLQITNRQRDAIVTFVQEAKRIQREGLDDNDAEKAIKSAVSGLTAVGVPIAAVYFSGSVIGLSAAGITSGLAALGLGLGMVGGIGVVVLIGTGVFVGTRMLLGDRKKIKEQQFKAERDRKAQLAIKNLQDTISVLLERLTILEAKVADLEKNGEAIIVLRERLEALKRVLQQRQGRFRG